MGITLIDIDLVGSDRQGDELGGFRKTKVQIGRQRDAIIHVITVGAFPFEAVKCQRGLKEHRRLRQAGVQRIARITGVSVSYR